MVDAEKVKAVFARHKIATLLWVICGIGFILMQLGQLPFGISYGGSMWPTFSHLSLVVIDRAFPVDKIRVGDIITFKKCEKFSFENESGDFTIACKPYNLIDYFRGTEIGHRVIKRECYALLDGKSFFEQEDENKTECRVLLPTGEQSYGCGDDFKNEFEKVDKTKIECVFTQKGDCAECGTWNAASDLYTGKVVWYFNFPV